jgi:hypothetical protein
MSSGVDLTPSLVGLILFPDKRKPLWKSLRRPENPSLVGFIRFLDVRVYFTIICFALLRFNLIEFDLNDFNCV